MKMYDGMGEIGEVSPKTWLKDAYLRIDEALTPLMRLGNTLDAKQELSEYLDDTDDELGKAIWLILNYDARVWMLNEEVREEYEGERLI